MTTLILAQAYIKNSCSYVNKRRIIALNGGKMSLPVRAGNFIPVEELRTSCRSFILKKAWQEIIILEALMSKIISFPNAYVRKSHVPSQRVSDQVAEHFKSCVAEHVPSRSQDDFYTALAEIKQSLDTITSHLITKGVQHG